MEIFRGDVWMCRLNDGTGSEQKGLRPCCVIQNDTGNRYSPTVLVVPFTTSTTKHPLPTHVLVEAAGTGLKQDSLLLCEQIFTVDKVRLRRWIGALSVEQIKKMNVALKVSIGVAD